MTSTRTWSLGAAVLALLLVVAAWFLLISPQRSQAAEPALPDRAAARSQPVDRGSRRRRLKAQYASLSDREKDLAVIRRQAPRQRRPALAHPRPLGAGRSRRCRPGQRDAGRPHPVHPGCGSGRCDHHRSRPGHRPAGHPDRRRGQRHLRRA
nr:hypothetical protein [Angustibacter aerolatus]